MAIRLAKCRDLLLKVKLNVSSVAIAGIRNIIISTGIRCLGGGVGLDFQGLLLVGERVEIAMGVGQVAVLLVGPWPVELLGPAAF